MVGARVGQRSWKKCGIPISFQGDRKHLEYPPYLVECSHPSWAETKTQSWTTWTFHFGRGLPGLQAMGKVQPSPGMALCHSVPSSQTNSPCWKRRTKQAHEQQTRSHSYPFIRSCQWTKNKWTRHCVSCCCFNWTALLPPSNQMQVCFTTEQPQANFFLKSFLSQ